MAFFGVDDLPKRYNSGVDIEYFEEAIELVLEKYREDIDPDRVGLVGVSKGTQLTFDDMLPKKWSQIFNPA